MLNDFKFTVSVPPLVFLSQWNSSNRLTRLQVDLLDNHPFQETLPQTDSPFLTQIKSLLQKQMLGKDFLIPDELLDWGRLSILSVQVLKTLLQVPYGSTISYAGLAEKSGLNKNHARFVGTVMRKNPFPFLLPCHRVIKSNGKLGLYTPRNELKEFLLDLEQGKLL